MNTNMVNFMNEINKFSAQLIQANADDTKKQRTALQETIRNTGSPQLREYLESVYKVLDASEMLDTLTIKMISPPPPSLFKRIVNVFQRIFK